MATLTKQPSIFQSENLYIEWEQNVQIWSMFTDLPKEKQGPEIFLTLSTNICECFQHIVVTDIGREDSLQIITDKLDEIYLEDENTGAYMSFKEFYL